MPCTPIAESASRTSSSLNGLMMAVTSFMCSPLSWNASERVADEADHALVAPVLAEDREVDRVPVGVLVVRAGGEAVAEVVGRAQLPHRVREIGVVEVAVLLPAPVALVADHAVQREPGRERLVHRELEVIAALAAGHAEDVAQAVRILEG